MQLWRLLPGSGAPVLISSLTKDNSPCVLPDGTIVSLWRQRPGNSSGENEIKLMSADVRQYTLLLTGQAVSAAGMGCAGGS